MKKVKFNLSKNVIKEYEKEEINHYEDYLSSVQKYLCSCTNNDDDYKFKKKEIVININKINKINR